MDIFRKGRWLPRGRDTKEGVQDESEADSARFHDGHEPGPNDDFIAVMGPTGSGKTSFISLCCGNPVSAINGLGTDTTSIAVYAYDTIKPLRTTYLIDTPGFDETDKIDSEELRDIARRLESPFTTNTRLSGIIYLHRITDIRLSL